MSVFQILTIMSAPVQDSETVLAMQQVHHFQNERDTWRTLLHKNGREFSVYAQSIVINGTKYKDLRAANASHSAKELLNIFLSDKLDVDK